MNGALGRWVTISMVGVGALAMGGVATARRQPASRAPVARGVELHVPHAPAAIVLDGDVDDPGWRGGAGHTHAFVASDGADALPYSDARFAWGDGHLYVALYAADQDIVATFTEGDSPLWLEDAFVLHFSDGVREETIDLSALGVVTDGARAVDGRYDYTWSSGVHVSREIDGTPNDSRDDDEEWLLEVAVPLDAIGLEGRRGERVALDVRRCDTPKRAHRSCASWNGAEGGTLILD